jgi:outer membrane protein assembly factor BamB
MAVTAGLEASPRGEDDWPRFRGPDGLGVSQDARIPTEWSETRNLKWKLALPGPGFSSPIVVGSRVFVTCYSDADGDLGKLKRHLVGVDRQTGKIAWSRAIPSGGREAALPGMAAHHGYASHTPVSDGERIYVLCGATGVVAFDMKGRELWRKGVGEEGATRFGSASSPVLFKDRLIVTAGAESRTIRAFDKKTGKEVWKTKAVRPLSRCYSTPAIVKNAKGEDELLISVPFEVWSLNPVDGQLKWYAETGVDAPVCPSVISGDGIAYVIGGRRGVRAAVRVGGKGDMTKKNVIWATNGGAYVPSPVLHAGHLYWVADSGIVQCVDAKTGKQVQRKRIRDRFYASVVLIQDKLYAVSRFGGTYVLKATPELEQIAHNKLDDKSDFSASPAVSRGQLFLRSDRFLYCIEAGA